MLRVCRACVPAVLAVFSLLAAPHAPIVSAQNAASQKRLVIRAAHLIDPRTGRRIDNPVVVVEGDKIASVASGAQLSPDATSIAPR